MKTLLLVRHSEAEDGFGKQDYDRQLTTRGIQKVSELVLKIKEQQFSPQLMITSSAARTYQTTKLIAEGIGYEVDKIASRQRIYNTSLDTLWYTVVDLPNEVDTVVLVNHNPAISFLIGLLVAPKQHISMQPCGAYCLQFQLNDWSELAENQGYELWCYQPKW